MDSYISEFFSAYWIQTIIAVIIAYLIGSVNTSIIVTRIVRKKDIRTMGSGNAGFTNVLRCVGKVPAICTFIGDFLKGIISVAIAYLMMTGASGNNADIFRGYIIYITGMFAVIGHMFPCYYGFKGGKGVVTTASVMLMTDWRSLLIALIIFAIVFLLTKIISKCALVNAAMYPVCTFVLKLLDYNGISILPCMQSNPPMSFIIWATAVTLIIAVLVIVRHKDNIKRIIDGTEKKITSKK